MKNLVMKYGGAIIFYTCIVLMIVLVNARFTYLNEINSHVTYAYND
ncbi:MAG: hypothetical protein RR478_02310 [Bacilli bacterium]